MIPTSEPGRLRVTAKDTDLSRYVKVTIPLMAPDSTLELFIDEAGLERIGARSRRCQRACCVAPVQRVAAGACAVSGYDHMPVPPDPIPAKVNRPALRYHGGKHRLAPWVESFFPEHVCYVEPFGGSGAVLLRKVPSDLDVWNDLNDDAFNFLTILRTRTDELIRAIELTPFSRTALARAFEPVQDGDPLERALRFYVRSWQCMGGPRDADSKSGWRFERNVERGRSNLKTWSKTDHLWPVAARLKLVQIESDDAFKIIRRFDAPTTLFYIDPPYVTSTRGQRWQQVAYRYEFGDEDHRRLAQLLHRVEGHVLVSGYESELYSRLYEGWRLETRETNTQAHTKATECLWISPSPAERRKLWREKRAFGQLEFAIDDEAAA